MKTESEIKGLIHGLYFQVGGDPNDLQIIPEHGGWGTALSYEVSKEDGRKMQIRRSHIDDENYLDIKRGLSQLL